MGDLARELLEGVESPEIEAGVADMAADCTAALMSLVTEKVGSLWMASEAAGLSPTYLYRVQKGERRMSFGIIARLLVANGVSKESFWRRIFELQSAADGTEKGLMGPPPALLADWREPGAEKDSPFLGRLDGWLEAIEGLKLSSFARSPVWRPLVLTLEQERLNDWRRLRRRLEKVTLQCARKAGRQETVSRMELADLATLLAAWAAVQRVAGLRGFAADGLTRAFALAERSGDPWTQAFCLQKAAYLSHDLGRDDQALAMIGKAAVHLTEAGGPDDLARLAVDRGYFSYYCGKLREARRLFEHGLSKLDPGHRLYRASAHLALARILREDGDLANARREVERAIAIPTPASVESAYVLWKAGEHELQSGAFDRAESHLHEALKLFGKFGTTSDVILVSLDRAELLLKTGRTTQLKYLVAEIMQWLMPLTAAKTSLMKPFENLFAMATLGSLGLMEIDSARDQCKKAFARFRADSFVG
jgi:tetratricopeptide (TPR) repeat protein